MNLALAATGAFCGAVHHQPFAQRSITDVIHRSIDLHPLCVQVIDTPEFQRLRGVSQLAACRWVFPGAVHDRFQHSLGVAHLAEMWASHFRRVQPELGITDCDVLCVTLAGLMHDLGHGPFSHFWEASFLPATADRRRSAVPAHEELSCALFDRLLASNEVDPAPWLEPSGIAARRALATAASPPRHRRACVHPPGAPFGGRGRSRSWSLRSCAHAP